MINITLKPDSGWRKSPHDGRLDMIGRLYGVLLSKQPPEILVDVNGVGYEVEVPLSLFGELPDAGQQVTLVIHQQITENSHNLYGFIQPGQRQLFRSLLKISGVGAKMALAILSGMNPAEFTGAIQAADVTALTRISGVGKKTAERLVMELRDKLGDSEVAGSPGLTATVAGPRAEARHALEALGYKPVEAQALIKHVANDEMTAEAIIRAALQQAGSR